MHEAGRARLGDPVAGVAGLVVLVRVVLVPVGVASSSTHHKSPAGVTLAGGCKGEATSHQQRGKVYASASGPEAPGATPSRPFHLARYGTIDWSGSTPVPFNDHTWWVHVDGFPALSGGSPNAAHATSASGVVDVGSFLPSWLGLTGLYYLNGQVSGAGDTCTGALYVSFTGDPATGVAMWAGIVLVLFGLALLLGSRPSWYAVFRVLPTGSVVATRIPAKKTTTPRGGGTDAPIPPSPGTEGEGS